MQKKNTNYSEEFLQGKKFHLLSYLGELHHDSKYNYIATWLCECGVKFKYNIYHVIHGRKKSCGCKRYQLAKNNPLWDGIGDISGSHWYRIQNIAKKRKNPFEITLNEVWELFLKQNRKCALTGVKLKFQSSCRDRTGTASLDRIDSSKGYVKGNIQWVHKTVNAMKLDMSEEELLEWCNKLIKKSLTNKKLPVIYDCA